MNSVSTHVLDTGTGKPGSGITVTLARSTANGWQHVAGGITDDDGRLTDLGAGLGSGVYRLVFDTGEYGNTFYPEAHIVIRLEGSDEHYHVPLLLSPFGFTTYRGS